METTYTKENVEVVITVTKDHHDNGEFTHVTAGDTVVLTYEKKTTVEYTLVSTNPEVPAEEAPKKKK